MSVSRVNFKITKKETKRIIKDVTQHHDSVVKRRLNTVFTKYYGGRINKVYGNLIWDAEPYSSLAWDVLNRLMKKHSPVSVKKHRKRRVRVIG